MIVPAHRQHGMFDHRLQAIRNVMWTTGGVIMRQILAVSTFLVLMGSAAVADTSIDSPCGHAAGPDIAGDTSVVCVSVCGYEFAYNGCTASQGPPTPTASEDAPGPARGVEFLSIRIYGDELSVAELAGALEHATGWTTEVPPALASKKLRPARRQLSESKSRTVRFRLQEGGKLLLNVDNEQKKLAIVRL
jgi:hypothetical protein